MFNNIRACDVLRWLFISWWMTLLVLPTLPLAYLFGGMDLLKSWGGDMLADLWLGYGDLRK